MFELLLKVRFVRRTRRKSCGPARYRQQSDVDAADVGGMGVTKPGGNKGAPVVTMSGERPVPENVDHEALQAVRNLGQSEARLIFLK
jgi:hypothetical protein